MLYLAITCTGSYRRQSQSLLQRLGDLNHQAERDKLERRHKCQLRVHISKWDRKGNRQSQGLRPQATCKENSHRKEQTKSRKRKSVHQIQMPVQYRYLSLGALSTSIFFPSLSARLRVSRRLLASASDRKDAVQQEHRFGGRF